MARHHQDETGEIRKYARQIIKAAKNTHVDDLVTTFWDLRRVKFLFTFRDEPRKDEEKRFVSARVKVLSPELRDLFGKDVHIEICEPTWRQLTVRWKKRLVKHELRHVKIDWDDKHFEETGERLAKTDKEGRLKVSIEPHDLVLRTFEDDIEEWGLSNVEFDLIRRLLPYYRAVKKGEAEKYTLPRVLIEGPEADKGTAEDDAA